MQRNGGRAERPRVERKPGIEWLKPGLIARVRYLKGEEKLRHATLQEVSERDG